MTLFGRDMSDYDTNESLGGLAFLTHKATEGTGVVHRQMARRLNAARAAEIPVLGAYHVVRSVSISGQVSHYLSYLDGQVPWWRSWPHWLHQVDLEIWPYDNVSAATGRSFVQALIAADPGRCVLTYASHGQYGNSLTSWPTGLWNANYGANSGAYPGDGAAAWGAYSGQTPLMLQYASNPYDKNAFRGSLAELLTLTGGSGSTTGDDDMWWFARLVGHDEVFLTDGITARWVMSPQDLADWRLLASEGRMSINRPTEIRDLGNKGLIGWIVGPVPDDPVYAGMAVPTASLTLSEADRAAIVAALAGTVPTLDAIADAVADRLAGRLAE